MIEGLNIGRPTDYLPKEIGHSPTQTQVGGNPCTHCGLDATGNPMWYYHSCGFGSKLVCKKCHEAINKLEAEIGPCKYDDFDKWNLLANAFPKIYRRDFYADKEVRKILNLHPLT